MARKPRIHFPGALYHVMVRGNAGQDIFTDDKDRCRFLLFLQEGIERYGHRVLAFCLMTNHVHLAIQVGSVPLSRIMQNLDSRYTRWMNWRLHRTGHLLQGRYSAILVDADNYLLELVAYLHLNPVRAGMTDTPDAYPWSSHHAYLGRETIPWLQPETTLSLFAPEIGLARQRFARFVAEHLADGHKDEFHGKASIDSRLMGEDHFVEDVLDRTESLPAIKPCVDEVLAAVSKLYGVDIATLAAPSQERRLSEARSLAAWAVHNLTDAPLKELAVRLNREISSLSSSNRRFEQRQMIEQDGDGKISRLKQALQLAILQT